MLFSRSNRQTPVGEVVKIGAPKTWSLQRVRDVASRTLPGCLAIGVLTFIGYQLHLSVLSASSLFLVVVAFQSLGGDFAAAVVVSFLSFASLDYFFTAPLFSFTVASPLEFLDLIAFLIIALIVTRLVSQLRIQVKS